MLRFLAAAAACLAVSAAAAEDMPGLATLSPPDAVVQAPPPAPGILPQGSAPSPGRRGGTDQAAERTVADLRAQAGTPRPWCAQERRVGTGAGFCLIN